MGNPQSDDEGAVVGCQSGLRPRDTPLGLILFMRVPGEFLVSRTFNEPQ